MKWEYKVRILEDSIKTPVDIELNKYGNEEWELVSFVQIMGNYYKAVFKRPKQN